MKRDFDQVSNENGFHSHFRIRQCSRLCRFARMFSQILAFTIAILYILEHSAYDTSTEKQSLEDKSEKNFKIFMNVTNGYFNKSPSRTTKNPTQNVGDDLSSNVTDKPNEASKVNTYFHWDNEKVNVFIFVEKVTTKKVVHNRYFFKFVNYTNLRCIERSYLIKQ